MPAETADELGCNSLAGTHESRNKLTRFNREMKMDAKRIDQFCDEIDERGWFQAFWKTDGKGRASIDMRQEDSRMRAFFSSIPQGQTDRFKWDCRKVDGLVNVNIWRI